MCVDPPPLVLCLFSLLLQNYNICMTVFYVCITYMYYVLSILA